MLVQIKVSFADGADEIVDVETWEPADAAAHSRAINVALSTALQRTLSAYDGRELHAVSFHQVLT